MREPVKGQPESVETAFQALDHQNLHELGKVSLALPFALIHLAFVVKQWRVSGVGEVGSKQLQRLVEYLVFLLAELVEQRGRVLDLGELQALLSHVLAVVLLDLGSGAPHHQELQDLLAGLFGVRLNRAEIEFPVGLPIQPLKLRLKAREECFEIAEVRYVAGLACLKKFDLAQNIQRRVVQWCGGNKDDPFASADLGKHFVALGRFRSEAMGLINEDVFVFLNVPPEDVL